MDWKATAVPAEIREGLNVFSQQVQNELGEQLVSVIVYGGVAKGEFAPGSSDVNVMVVVRESTMELLDRLSPALEKARRDIQLSLLLLTELDLTPAGEVFSTKFLDIQRYHIVLFGTNVTERLSVTADRLRRQCAREIMNLQLRLRQFYLQRMRRPEMIENTLKTVISPFLRTLSVLIELNTGQRSPTKAVAAAAAGKLDLDSPLLENLLRLKRGELKPDAAELKRLYAAFMDTVEEAARAVQKE